MSYGSNTNGKKGRTECQYTAEYKANPVYMDLSDKENDILSKYNTVYKDMEDRINTNKEYVNAYQNNLELNLKKI